MNTQRREAVRSVQRGVEDGALRSLAILCAGAAGLSVAAVVVLLFLWATTGYVQRLDLLGWAGSAVAGWLCFHVITGWRARS